MSIRAALAEQTAKTKGLANADIRRLIADSELRVASLESNITELKSAAAPMEDDGPDDSTLKFVEGEAPLASSSLLEQRDRERITAAVLRHLIAPIRSLPVELLAEIFSLTIRDNDDPLLSTRSRFVHFQDAYRVSHICSEWRQITLSSPQLWTGPINVTVQDPVAQDAGWTVTATGLGADGLMIRAWLAHSDPLPVPIVLTGLDDLPEPILAGLRNGEALHLPLVLEELLRVAPRWGILHLYGFLPSMFYQCLVDCTLDSLEEANLLMLDADGCITAPASLLGNSPRLRKLNLHIPLLDPPGTSVTLPSLRVLELTVHSERNTRLSPFEFLSAPALETCSISFVFKSISWTQAAFTAFLLRSPNLTDLHLLSCPLTSSDLIAALSHAPSLTHLELDNCHHLDNTFLLALHYKVGTPPLAPLLHVLRLLHIPESLTESLIIVGMLASRWSAGPATARWSRVTLSPPSRREFTEDFRDAIRELEHQGIPVEIRT
ncbi:hypothetical protein B0H16DRAFT_919407 [Mycena metata]|uniref:F-box domain-containing protein n=1 Tax=Mycena metata TaxID=1033252 RepID=A0AAD7DM51_9AGAR|nr:hypothetical protein B0H16DRAFT_919407 [Mycena metata]